ncbi:MAG: hypothetical protein KDC54_12855, partial [Lewinella sp.]|nr:hypothetical protein [Lewinella sp.]
MVSNTKNRLLLDQMLRVRAFLIEQEHAYRDTIKAVHPHYRGSAANLIHYLALRTFNLRDVQAELSQRGLSSIGHSERYTLANIDNIIQLLRLVVGDEKQGNLKVGKHQATFRRSTDWLNENTQRLFGAGKHSFPTRTMVTMPSEAASDYRLIKRLLDSGMEIARINCSHDDEHTWEKMIKNLSKDTGELNTHCLVYMDLGGPKLRTGPVKEQKPKKKKKKPVNYLTLHQGDRLHLYRTPVLGKDAKYDDLGNLIRPARIGVTLPAIFDHLENGQTIWFDDGSIGAQVLNVGKEYAILDVTQADINGSKLRGEKGINLPETTVDLPALTEEDL